RFPGVHVTQKDDRTFDRAGRSDPGRVRIRLVLANVNGILARKTQDLESLDVRSFALPDNGALKSARRGYVEILAERDGRARIGPAWLRNGLRATSENEGESRKGKQFASLHGVLLP